MDPEPVQVRTWANLTNCTYLDMFRLISYLVHLHQLCTTGLSTSRLRAARRLPCSPGRCATCWLTGPPCSSWSLTSTALLAGPVWLGLSSMLLLWEGLVNKSRFLHTMYLHVFFLYFLNIYIGAISPDLYVPRFTTYPQHCEPGVSPLTAKSWVVRSNPTRV
jgi:hypothetical protein